MPLFTAIKFLYLGYEIFIVWKQQVLTTIHHNDPANKMPSAFISAGVHGNEIGAMIMLAKLEELFLKEKWSIKVAFANYCNPSAIRNRQRKSTAIDTYDMNRGWSSDSPRMEMEKLLKGFDILIDLHCSWKCTEYFLFNNGQNISYEWLENQGIPFAIREGDNDTLKMHATRNCQIGMTWET